MTQPTKPPYLSPSELRPGYYWCRWKEAKRRTVIYVSEMIGGGMIAYECGHDGGIPLDRLCDWSGPIKEDG